MFYNQNSINVVNFTSNFDYVYTLNITSTQPTSNFYHWPPKNQNIIQGIILLILSIVGCIFNSYIIIAIIPNQRLRTVRNILLLHLAIVGLMNSVLMTFFAAVVSLYGYWIGGIVTCKMYGFLESSYTAVTVWTIAALSWDKYQTIASPLHHSLSATLRKMTCLFSVFWILAILLSVPPLFLFTENLFHPMIETCFLDHFKSTGSWYVSIVVSGVFYLPLSIMIYCYTHIFRIARTQSSRIAATMIRMTCVVQAPIVTTGQSNAISTSIKGTKAMLTILQLVGTFTITYIPYSIVIVVHSYCSVSCVNTVFSSVVITLFQAAPVTNGAVYGIRNKILRNSFYRYMRREIRHMCYKDKRRGSVKSRTSSFRMSLRKNLQNGGPENQPFRRTQSLKATHLAPSRPSLLNLPAKDSLRKTQSFTLANGHPISCLEEDVLTPIKSDGSEASDQIITIPEVKELNGNVTTEVEENDNKIYFS